MLRNPNFVGAIFVMALLLTIVNLGDQKCHNNCEAGHSEHAEEAHGHGDAAESHEASGDHESHEDHGTH